MSLPPIRYINPGTIAPQASAGAAMAAGQAVTQIGHALENVGEQGAQIVARVRKMEEGGKINTFMANADKEAGEFAIGLARRSDTDAWPTEWQDHIADLRERAKSLGLSPEGMAHLDNQFSTWSTSRAIHFETQAATKALGIAKAQTTQSLEYYAARGDKEGFDRTLRTGTGAGILDPADQQAAQMHFNTKSAALDLDRMVEGNPQGILDQSEDSIMKVLPGATPEMIARAKDQAEVKVNRHQADYWNNVIISGKIPDEEELKVMADTGKISTSQHARAVSSVRQNQQPASDPAVYEETYGQIMAYDPGSDPSGRTEAQLRQWIATQPLPKEEIKLLGNKLNERLNPATSKQPKSIHESAFAAKIGSDFTRGDWGKYRFPVDSDNDPSTPPTTPINPAEYDKAWRLRGEFSDQWRGILKSLPEDASFETVNGAYETLKTSFKDKKPMPDLDFSKPSSAPFDADSLYKQTSGTQSFGGQPVKPAGTAYTGATATVFGGKNDPADNGESALGGPTGPGGREGTAIPQKLLAAKFPGRDKAWIDSNVRTVVRGPGGVMHTLSVADFGTAEWVWQRNGRPVLDLTEGAAKQLGGRVTYTPAGKLAGVKGLDNLSFAVVSTETAAPLKGASWEDAKASWFQKNRPTSNEQIQTSLIALRDRWNRENMPPASRNTGDLSQYNVIPE